MSIYVGDPFGRQEVKDRANIEVAEYYEKLTSISSLHSDGRFKQELGSGVFIELPCNPDNRAPYGTMCICGDPGYGKSVVAKTVCCNLYHHPDFVYASADDNTDSIIVLDGLQGEWYNNITKLNPDTNIRKSSLFIPDDEVVRLHDPPLYVSSMSSMQCWEMAGFRGRFGEIMLRIAKAYNLHFDDPNIVEEIIDSLAGGKVQKEYEDVIKSKYVGETTSKALKDSWIAFKESIDCPKDYPHRLSTNEFYGRERSIIDHIRHHKLMFNKRVFIVEMELRSIKSKILTYLMGNRLSTDYGTLEFLRPIIFMEEADYLMSRAPAFGTDAIPNYATAAWKKLKLKSRKPGIFMIFITQYPSLLDPDLIKGAAYKISGRLDDSVDRKAVCLPDKPFPDLDADPVHGLRMFLLTDTNRNFMFQFVPVPCPCESSQPERRKAKV